MNVIISEQLTALSLLIVFLFGITFGVIGGAVHGSRHGVLLVSAADDLRSAGARVILGFWFRGYPRNLPCSDQGSHDPHGSDLSESRGREADR